jgi:tetratricopeptide (TPR) repeat protein
LVQNPAQPGMQSSAPFGAIDAIISGGPGRSRRSLEGVVVPETGQPVHNDFSGTAAGPVVQAGTIHGGVHMHVAAAPSMVPRQLPGTVRDFVNRKHEQSGLTSGLLDLAPTDHAPRLCVIDGTAGAGKTALAIHWSRSVEDRFPDGQLYVNLLGFDPSRKPLQPIDALQVLLEGLGIGPDRVPSTEASRAGMYRSALANRRVLLVLDNALESTQVAPLLPGTGSCAVVVTSRHRLDSLIVHHGAIRIALGTLTNDDARDLLSRHLTEAPENVIDAIATRCGRLPLALSIVAARTRSYPDVPPATLAQQLYEERGELDALDTGEETTSVRAVFSWSYRSLDPGTARAFRLLALHPGPDIGIPTAESLLGFTGLQALRHLRALVRANLLEEYMPNRFRFHDLLRVYAAEQASDDEPVATRNLAVRRFLDGFLRSAANASLSLNPNRSLSPLDPPVQDALILTFGSRGEAMNWFQEEYQNLKSTIEWTASHGFEDHTWRLTQAFWQYLYLCGRWHEIVALNQMAIAAAEHLGNTIAKATEHTSSGVALAMLGNNREAVDQFRVALDLYRAVGDLDGEGNALDSLAWAYTRSTDFQTAISYCEKALEVYRRINDPEGQARALDSLSVACAGLGRYDEGLGYGQQALRLHEQTGSLIGQAHVLRSLGQCYARMARYAEAITRFESALALCRDIDDRHDEAKTLVDLGRAQHASGDANAARDSLEQAITILTELRDPDVEAVRADLQTLAAEPRNP